MPLWGLSQSDDCGPRSVSARLYRSHQREKTLVQSQQLWWPGHGYELSGKNMLLLNFTAAQLKTIYCASLLHFLVEIQCKLCIYAFFPSSFHVSVEVPLVSTLLQPPLPSPTHISPLLLPCLHLEWERTDWCSKHATVVSIYRDQTSAGISLTPKGLPGCPLPRTLSLILIPSFLPHPPPPLPPPSPFNIEAGDEKWCAFVYLPPMQMRPQQD